MPVPKTLQQRRLGPSRRRFRCPPPAPKAPKSPRTDWIRSKDRRLRLSAVHKGWQGAKSLVPARGAWGWEPRLRCAEKELRVPFGIVSKPLETWLNVLQQKKHG